MFVASCGITSEYYVENEKKEKLSLVLCDDEDVNCVWGTVSPNSTEEEMVYQDLLREIVYLLHHNKRE